MTAAQAAPKLEIDNVSLHFPVSSGLPRFLGGERRAVRAVQEVSFSLARGEIVGLAGESGCGKSSLARLLMKMESPTGGAIRVAGSALQDIPREALPKHVQMVFQDPFTSLNPRRRVGDILAEPLLIHTDLSAGERRARVIEMLQRVGLGVHHVDRFPHEFSGGQRQRIAIGRALMLKPDFLVLDEPTSALDVSVQAMILNFIRELQRDFGVGCLFITHDLNLMRFMTSRLAIMYLGRIVEYGDTRAIFDDPKHPYTKALLDATPGLDPNRVRHERLSDEIPSNTRRPKGCAFHTRCPRKIGAICETEAPPAIHAEGRELRCHLYEGTVLRAGKETA